MVAHYSCDSMNQIYADNAATTRLNPDALSAMLPYYQDLFGNPSSRHFMSKKPRDAIQKSSKIIASVINCDPSEIIYTSGGTESDNWALCGLISSEKNHIITTSIEHAAILRTCEFLQKYGVNITYLPVDSTGTVDVESLADNITPHTAVVSIMHGNNEIGTIQDISSISKIVHDNSSYFHTDAVQTVGHIPIDVKSMGVDLLSSSAHKFNGPRGVGFLYVRKGVPIKSFIHGGNQQYAMRSGTENVPGIVGMATALSINNENIVSNQNYLRNLEKMFYDNFNPFGIDFRYNGNLENKIPGLISISFKNLSAEAIVDLMSIKGICISAGSACNSNSTELSHVLKSIRVPKEYALGTIRISFGISNTKDDVLHVCESLSKVVISMKNLSNL